MKRRSRPALKIRLMVWEKASDKEFSYGKGSDAELSTDESTEEETEK